MNTNSLTYLPNVDSLVGSVIQLSVIFQVQTAENSAATESVQRQLSETVDKLHRTEQVLADAQKVRLL